jgi:serine/threonine-protein kinase
VSQSRPTASPDPTEIAGRYEIVKKLGAGAFGTVYKARDKTLGRMLAIKTIRLEGLAAASTDLGELLRRFKQEATAGAALKHPNIVTVYDFGQSEGMTYLAMEYVEGQGLERIIAESGKLPLARAAGLTAQVADALGYAHQHNVIHRDIKPANVMVEAGERAKVTDFGIARVTNSGENLTQTGGLLGTPSYMSPEQARGQKVDGRSDLFSVGCVLYELLTGRKAFGSDTITGILFKIITEDPPPIRELDPLLPEQAVGIVEKALAKSPDARYQTGRELADDLLALTQPGYVPTVRQTSTPTTPVGASAAPTIATPPTARGTLASSPTVARDAAADRGATVPVAPTELLSGPPPPTAPPPQPTAARPRRPQPASARPQAGGGKGRLVGVVVAAFVVLALLATGTWMVLGRRDPVRTATTDAGATAEIPPTGTDAPPPAAAPASGPESGPPAGAVPPAAPPRTAAGSPSVASPAPATGAATTAAAPPRAAVSAGGLGEAGSTARARPTQRATPASRGRGLPRRAAGGGPRRTGSRGGPGPAVPLRQRLRRHRQLRLHGSLQPSSPHPAPHPGRAARGPCPGLGPQRPEGPPGPDRSLRNAERAGGGR